MVGKPASLSASSEDRLGQMINYALFGRAPAHIINTWAEHKRKQALHKLGLILYVLGKRELTTLCDIKYFTYQFILKGDILNSNFY